MSEETPPPPEQQSGTPTSGRDELPAIRTELDRIRAQLIEQEHRTTHVALNAYRYFGKKSPEGDAARKALIWRIVAPYTAAAIFAGGGGIIAGVTAFIAYQQTHRMTRQNELISEQTGLLTQQTQRLTEQNQLIQLQARLAAIARQADLEQQSAARAYDEITRILDANALAGAIVNALDRLPEAMVMPVTIVKPEWIPTPESTAPVTKTVYPNLVPLAQRLLTFAKTNRPAKDAIWSKEEVGSVSTSIVQAFHRLGFGNSTDTPEGGCVWHCVFDEDGMPRSDADTRLADLIQIRTNQTTMILATRPSRFVDARDFRHARPGQLAAVKLQGANLYEAQLQDADLSEAQLQDAELWFAQLQDADLSEAQLQGADFNDAQLQGADLNEAQLQGARFWDAQLQDANLWRALLQGADLSEAQLQGADLSEAQLHDANLSEAQLQGADLGEAELQGVYLKDAQLQGADLIGAQLQGAVLRYAVLSGGRVHFFVDYTVVGSLQTLLDADVPAAVESCAIVAELDLPPTYLAGVGLGKAVGFDVDNLELDDLQGRVEPWAWWPTRDAAVADLRERLGDKADVAIAALREERPTDFTGASLDGVLIDQDTLNTTPATATSPSPAEAFAKTNTDPAALEALQANPYVFPSREELLRLAKQQAAERTKEASAPQSTPASPGQVP